MKYQIILTIFIVLLVGIFLTTSAGSPKKAHAQTCQSSTLNQGLISALSITGGGVIGNVDQNCVYDPQAAYRDFNVPSYEELENQFYDLTRSSARQTAPRPNGAQNFSGSGIYLQKTSMNIPSATGTGVQIIFVRGNLYITGDITYANADPYSGLVFIVSGDINIDSNVTKVNAVLISSGEICTAYDSAGSACLTGTTITPQLTINGSLISLNRTNTPNGIGAIKLVRNLATNNQPAELINKQPKYLYILRGGLLTKDLVLMEEDKIYNITSDPGYVPAPSQTPGPSACLGTNPLVVNSSPMPVVANCIIGI